MLLPPLSIKEGSAESSALLLPLPFFEPPVGNGQGTGEGTRSITTTRDIIWTRGPTEPASPEKGVDSSRYDCESGETDEEMDSSESSSEEPQDSDIFDEDEHLRGYS